MVELEKPTRGTMLKLLSLAKAQREQAVAEKFTFDQKAYQAEYKAAHKAVMERLGLVTSAKLFRNKWLKFMGYDPLIMSGDITDSATRDGSIVAQEIIDLIGEAPKRPYEVSTHSGKAVYPVIEAEYAQAKEIIMLQNGLTSETAKNIIADFKAGKIKNWIK